MPRMAISGVDIDTSHSAPPPMRNQSEPITSTHSGLDPQQAAALAKVAALAATRGGNDGPSKAMVTTAIALGVLVVAMLLLAAVVSIGPSPAG